MLDNDKIVIQNDVPGALSLSLSLSHMLIQNAAPWALLYVYLCDFYDLLDSMYWSWELY